MSGEAPDPRIHPYRDDIAADFLEGRVTAKRFVAGAARRVAADYAPLMTKPDAAALQASELLFGDVFTVYQEKDGWAWGQCGEDGYVGYAPVGALAPRGDLGGPAPTHRVTAARSLVFPDAKGEYPPSRALSMGAGVTVEGGEGDYARLAGGGWMFGKHLIPMAETVPDWIAQARLYLGTPYLWGGRGGLGIDCSGLIQVPLALAGIPVPRDSDQQAEGIGNAAPVPDDPANLTFGDIVFFPGHVGIFLGIEGFLHASSHSMTVAIHPMSDVLSRMRDRHGKGITAVRRVVVAV